MAETLDKLIDTEREAAPEQYRLLIGALHALSKQVHPAQSISDSYVLRARRWPVGRRDCNPAWSAAPVNGWSICRFRPVA